MARPQVYIDETGIYAPPYEEWLVYLQDTYRVIYGEDIYIAPDSQDGQLLAIFAQALFDTGNTAVATFNAYPPGTAQGAGLSSIVKINGLQRRTATFSTAIVTLVGQPGTIITNGIITDNLSLGTRWSVPTTTIPIGGSISVTATSLNLGDVRAGPGTLTRIVTPQPGWQTVTNSVAAVPGAPVESDAALRKRQAKSTSQMATTPLRAIVAAVANLPGVVRVTPYENSGEVVDANGIPPHAIALVVKGGDAVQIATTIANKKLPGTSTYGFITEQVIDQSGVPNIISFSAEAAINTYFLIKITALAGYTSIVGDTLKIVLSDAINKYEPGKSIRYLSLFSKASFNTVDAAEATGYPQSQLDLMSETYSLTNILQARDSMLVTNGPRTAGATTLNTVFASFTVGSLINVFLDNGTIFTATVVGAVGSLLTFTPAVPAGRNIPNGAIVYTSSDLVFAFYQAPVSLIGNIVLVVS